MFQKILLGPNCGKYSKVCAHCVHWSWNAPCLSGQSNQGNFSEATERESISAIYYKQKNYGPLGLTNFKAIAPPMFN